MSQVYGQMSEETNKQKIIGQLIGLLTPEVTLAYPLIYEEFRRRNRLETQNTYLQTILTRHGHIFKMKGCLGRQKTNLRRSH